LKRWGITGWIIWIQAYEAGSQLWASVTRGDLAAMTGEAGSRAGYIKDTVSLMVAGLTVTGGPEAYTRYGKCQCVK